MDKSSLGDRMKRYEKASRVTLTGRLPLIIRLDGKAFHTLTKKLDKPYDVQFKDLMLHTAKHLLENIMGCKLAYVQSDEISLLLTDYDKLETEAWYDKQLQKIVSVSASIATAYFNKYYNNFIDDTKIIKDVGLFDSRAFVLPKEEVCNYFIWRQNDATRNSIQGLGQAHFSQKEMNGISNNDVQDKLMLEKGINWNDTESYFKRGGCVVKDCMVTIDNDIPQFTKDRKYIDQYVYITDVDSIGRQMRCKASHLLEESNEITPPYTSEMSSHASHLLEEVEENKAGIEKVGDINHEVGGTKVNLNIEKEEE